jgi:AcrR family transcriptional regulator
MLREVKKETKKRLILHAAIELFSKKGFGRVTVEDITRRAKVAKGAFYNYFDKKEDVLLFFLDQEIERGRTNIQFKFADKGNFVDQTEELFKSYLKYLFSRRDFAEVLVKERIMKMGTKKNINELKVIDTLVFIINLAKQRNEIKIDVDARKMAELIHCTVTYYFVCWLNKTLKNSNECMQKIKDAVIMLQEGVGTFAQKREGCGATIERE